MKKLLILLALTAAPALLASGCGTTATYAATIDGDELSQKGLTAELTAIRDNKEYAEAVEKQLASSGGKLQGSGKNTFDASFTARVLTRQIFLEIVSQGVKEKKLEVKDEDLKKAREEQEQQFEQQFGSDKVWKAFLVSYQDALVRRAAEVAVLQRGLSKSADQTAVADFYEKNKDQFRETCSRHILASFPGNPRDPNNPPPTPEQENELKAKAQVWKDRVAKGEDFAAIATAESGDTGSGAKGGDLGCTGGFVQEFTDAMNKLEPGQTSDPVRTQFGYHIIQVTSRKVLTLEEAKPRIEQQLEQESESVVQEYLTERLKKAKIKVNPKYGTFDKGNPEAGEQPQVIPPKGPATTTTTAAGGREEQDLPIQGEGVEGGGGAGAGAGGTGGGGANP